MGDVKDISKETSTILYFMNPSNLEDFDSPSIEVYWQTNLNSKESGVIFSKDRGAWIPEASAFYSTGIISDIEMFGEGN